MTIDKKYDVLILGCGPTGAVLANLINAKGYKVAIFDRDKEIFCAPRAMALDVESCRILNGIGLFRRLMEKDAAPPTAHRFTSESGKLLLANHFSTDYSDLGYPRFGAFFHQPALEAMLRERFSQGVEIDAFFGYEVLSVDGDGDQASLCARIIDTGEEVSFAGQFLVGADGGASTCRKYMNASRVDLNYSRDWIVMDLIVHDKQWWDAFREGSEFVCRPNGAEVVVKGFHGHVRFDFEQASEEAAAAFTEEDAYRLIEKYIDLDRSQIEIIRRQPYKFYAGMPDCWRRGRVFLAGDAAHQTSPFAGQGLNMGIRDAANLAFKFDMVFRGLVNDSFLDTYQDERWENCAHMIQVATEGGLRLSTTKWWEILMRNLAFKASQLSKTFAHAMTMKSLTVDPYKSGLVGNQHRLAGERLLPPRLQTPDGKPALLDELVDHRFALISRQRISGEGVDWLRSALGGTCLTIGKEILDSDGKLTQYFIDNKADVILIRPDFYIFDAGNGADTICNALRAQLTSYGHSSTNLGKSA